MASYPLSYVVVKSGCALIHRKDVGICRKDFQSLHPTPNLTYANLTSNDKRSEACFENPSSIFRHPTGRFNIIRSKESGCLIEYVQVLFYHIIVSWFQIAQLQTLTQDMKDGSEGTEVQVIETQSIQMTEEMGEEKEAQEQDSSNEIQISEEIAQESELSESWRKVEQSPPTLSRFQSYPLTSPTHSLFILEVRANH